VKSELAYFYNVSRILAEFVKLPPALTSQGLLVINIWIYSRPWQKILLRENTTWQKG